MKTKLMLLTHVQGQLSRAEMKQIMAGDESLGTCRSTCWTNGTEYLGEVEVTNCDPGNDSKCKDSYPSATKATCSCG